MYGKRRVMFLFPLIIVAFVVACNSKPSQPVATSSISSPTSTITIAVPKPTETPGPPTPTSTALPPTPTISPTPQTYPVAGKWVGRGDRGLLLYFSVITDNNGFIIIREFNIPKSTTLCPGYYYTVDPLPDMYAYNGEFGYFWFPSKIIATDKIEGIIYLHGCGNVALKWLAGPQSSE
jgi:hypothetical protein